jgi:hypothetical protein
MTLDASGNLGIGVTNPGYRFRVDGGYSVLGCYNTTSFPASLTAGGSGFSWNRSSGGAETNICNLYDNASLSFEFSQKTGASTANRLYQISSTSHIFFISDSEKARIDSSGNLMVNTTSAVGKFTAGGQSTDANNVITGANIVAGTVLALRERGNSAGISGATYASQMFVGPAGGNLEIYTVPSTAVVFGTAATERARITSGGDFLVGTTSTTGLDDGSSTNPGFATGSGTINLQRNNAANIFLSKASGYTSSAFVNFFVAGGAKGSITTDGTNVAYNTSSDYRLKDNPQPLTGSGAFIDALKPKTWTWKADGSKGVGFIAHEVQEVSPGSVVGEKDGEQMQAMEYGSAEFIANIIAELQSLRKRLADAGL